MYRIVNGSIKPVVLNISKCDIRLGSAKSIFPPDLFNLEERQRGAILIHILVAFYLIIFSEHVFDKYFLPSLEFLSFERLNLSARTAGSTILTIGTSVSELFMVLFGITLGKNDIALFTVLGSASYNMLIIASICCFCVYAFNIGVYKYILLKDSIFYALNLLLLIILLYKNNNSRLYWYDSLASMGFYLIFAIYNFNEEKINLYIKSLIWRTSLPQISGVVESGGGGGGSEMQSSLGGAAENAAENNIKPKDLILINKYKLVELILADSKNNYNNYQSNIYINDSYNEPYDFLQSYKEIKPLNLSKKFKLISVLPARIFAYVIIFDFRRFESRKHYLFAITLITSLLLIIASSFVLVWMSTQICETLKLPKSVFGLVFLASSLCMKETIAIQSTTKKELRKLRKIDKQKDDVSVPLQLTGSNEKRRLCFILSSFMSCNLFDLSMGIGLPFLINSLFFSAEWGNTSIYAGKNLAFILLGLIVCLSLFFLILMAFKFRLSMYFGFVLMSIWLAFMGFVIALELGFLQLDYLAFLKKFKC